MPADNDDDEESNSICTEDMSDLTSFAELSFTDSAATAVEEIVISGLTNVDEDTLTVVYEDVDGSLQVLELTVVSSTLESSPGSPSVLYVAVQQDATPLEEGSTVSQTANYVTYFQSNGCS